LYARQLVLDTGERWEPEDWQLAVVEDLFSGVQQLWMIVPQGNGKALALDTPIPTPDGWTEMGALEVGDEIFDDQGQRCCVSLATGVMVGHRCYRVVFSDGTSIVADADHLWRVTDCWRDERCLTTDVTVTTDHLAAKHRIDGPRGRQHRYSVPFAQPLDLEELLLPVEPYVLGAWLGDGATADGRVTYGDEFVVEEIARQGYRVGGVQTCGGTRTPTATIYGLKVALRQVGVLGNKHIPAIYLRASYRQRLNLLQGLMDTDGTISQPQGQCSLTSSSMRLAADALELVRSLGLKATIRERRAKLNGRDCGPTWVIAFTAYDDCPVFRMPRKYARQRLRPRGRAMASTRRIRDVIPVESVPVRCIQVDSPSSLYLAGPGMVATHNTTLMGGVALYHCDFTASPWVPIAAASARQARILYSRAEEFIQRTPELTRRFKPQSGYLRILSLANGGWGIQVYAADKDTGEGIIPTLCFVDDPHAQKNLGLYRTWRGKLRKRNGQIVAISTAGEPGTDFEMTRDKIRDTATELQQLGPCRIRAVAPKIIMHEFRVPHPAQARDLDAVLAANPLSTITRDDLEQLLADPTLDFGEDWLRKTCNIPARSSKAAVSESDWARAYSAERIPEGVPIWVGADFAWSQDTTALVPLWWRDSEFRLLGEARILAPPGNGDMLDPQEVWDALVGLNERNPIAVIAADKTKAQDTLMRAERELGCEVVDVDQGTNNQAEEYERFMEGLRGGGSPDEQREPWLRHTGDPELRRHVMNAIARKLPGDRYAFDRPAVSRQASKQDRRVIDALKAASMVNNVAVVENGGVGLEPLIAS
jgi:phage terminase large subunit-like protein